MAAVTASSSSSGIWVVGHSSTLRFSRASNGPPALRSKIGSQLGFLSSQLSNISISYDRIVLPKPVSAPVYRPFRPVAREELNVQVTDDFIELVTKKEMGESTEEVDNKEVEYVLSPGRKRTGQTTFLTQTPRQKSCSM